MAKLEIEYDEATNKFDTLPEPLQKFFDRRIAERVGETKRSLETRTSLDAVDRDELARLKREADERIALDLERDKKYDEAKAAREAQYQKDLTARDQELQRRDVRLRDMARAEIRAAAMSLGARRESLDELARILGDDIDLDADLNPFVKGSDGKPAVGSDQKPVTIEGHVKTYLDSHAHHRAASGGTGGGARGGASRDGGTVSPELQKAEEALAAAQAQWTNSRGSDYNAAAQLPKLKAEVQRLKAAA